MSDDTLAELFARDPTKQPHTDPELEKIILYYRNARANFMLDPEAAKKAAPKAKKESKVPLEDLLG